MHRNRSEIYDIQVDRGVALAWVNSYSAVVTKTPGATLLFDPVSMEVPEGVSLDLIAVSHSHSDHWDPPLVAALQQRTLAVLAMSPSLAQRLGGGEIPTTPLYKWGELGSGASRSQIPWGEVRPLQPGDELEIGDVTVTALRCDHAAVEPLAFQVRTGDGLTVYLPGDTTPFPEMEQLPRHDHSGSSAIPVPEAEGPKPRLDILLWMGTALNDGARIAELVKPKVFLTYAIAPPAAGVRAREILSSLTPLLPLRSLERHEVFSYPPN